MQRLGELGGQKILSVIPFQGNSFGGYRAFLCDLGGFISLRIFLKFATRNLWGKSLRNDDFKGGDYPLIIFLKKPQFPRLGSPSRKKALPSIPELSVFAWRPMLIHTDCRTRRPARRDYPGAALLHLSSVFFRTLNKRFPGLLSFFPLIFDHSPSGLILFSAYF